MKSLSIMLYCLCLVTTGMAQGFVSSALPAPATALSGGDVGCVAYLDPAQRYNQYILDNMNNVYTLVGNYKVMGTPYLFGGKHGGSIYHKGIKGDVASFLYNTYSQQLEMQDEKDKEAMFKIKVADIDSFLVDIESPQSGKTKLKFINSNIYGFKDAFILQVIVDSGSRYSLYKKYYSTLGVVTTNIMQSNLKQFELNIEYYYGDTATHEIKKLKPNAKAVTKEFKLKGKPVQLLESDHFSADPEAVLKDVFGEMNKENQ